MLARFSLLSAAWAHFSRLAAFVVPWARFFRDLGRSSLDFGAPSWLYVGTFFALKRFFGAFFASCCICRAFWSFSSRLGPLQLRFWNAKLAICWQIFRSWATFFDTVQELLQKNPAGIHFLLFVSTMQRGGTCEAHGIRRAALQRQAF